MDAVSTSRMSSRKRLLCNAFCNDVDFDNNCRASLDNFTCVVVVLLVVNVLLRVLLSNGCSSVDVPAGDDVVG